MQPINQFIFFTVTRVGALEMSFKKRVVLGTGMKNGESLSRMSFTRLFREVVEFEGSPSWFLFGERNLGRVQNARGSPWVGGGIDADITPPTSPRYFVLSPATSSPGSSPRRFSKWRLAILKSREGPGDEVSPQVSLA